jgi:hypothetical protein
MHPAGDELLVLLSGAIDIVLESESRTRTVQLHEGMSCIVPAGTEAALEERMDDLRPVLDAVPLKGIPGEWKLYAVA